MKNFLSRRSSPGSLMLAGVATLSAVGVLAVLARQLFRSTPASAPEHDLELAIELARFDGEGGALLAVTPVTTQ